MNQQAVPSQRDFPFARAPEAGELFDVVSGVKWFRMPLPFQLDHVNIYLIEDGDGWCAVDCGIADARSQQVWGRLFEQGIKLTRLIVTHHHPDHIGLAGWLHRAFGVPLLTSQTAYLSCENLVLAPQAQQTEQFDNFYRSHGMQPAFVQAMRKHGHDYLNKVTALPPTFLRLMAGDALTIGQRQFQVLSGDGHAPEQLMLYCAEERLLFCADQVIARISPNVSVWANEPEGDPLGHFLRSLQALKSQIADDVLLLPGHQLPFRGLHQRCDELALHHRQRCTLIVEHCRDEKQSVGDLVPLLFPQVLDPHQMGFAFREALAHVNRLLRDGQLVECAGADRAFRYAAS